MNADDPSPGESRSAGDQSALIEGYKCVSAFMRQYATLRFYQLALLLSTTGSIVTALSSQAVRASATRIKLLKLGGLVISLALLVMEFRSSTYWGRRCATAPTSWRARSTSIALRCRRAGAR